MESTNLIVWTIVIQIATVNCSLEAAVNISMATAEGHVGCCQCTDAIVDKQKSRGLDINGYAIH